MDKYIKRYKSKQQIYFQKYFFYSTAELTVTKDSSISVLFVKKEYAVMFKVKDDTGGTLNATVDGKPISSGSKVPYGTKISFTAAPNTAENYTVNAWTGISAAAGSATAELVVTKDSTVTVEFIKRPSGGGSSEPSTPNQPQNPPGAAQEYTVSFSVKDNTGGTLTAIAAEKPLNSGGKVKTGTKVRFTATPKSAEGYMVGAWTGTDAVPGTGVVELIITQDVTVDVAFVKRQCIITFDASEGGSVSATIGEDSSNLLSGGTAPYGSTVTFTAVPEEGYAFDRWEGFIAASSEIAVTYTVTGDRYVKAYFKSAALPYLTVNEYGRLWYKGDPSQKDEILKGRVVIPESIFGITVTAIAQGTFYHCTEITEVVIPRTVKTLEQSVCEGCTKLKKITLQGDGENGLTTISDKAFYGCYWLEELRLPRNVKIIDDDAFAECRKLTIYLPRTIERIGSSAFGRKAKKTNYDICVKMVYAPLGYTSHIRSLIDNGIGDCCYFPLNKIKGYDDTATTP